MYIMQRRTLILLLAGLFFVGVTVWRERERQRHMTETARRLREIGEAIAKHSTAGPYPRTITTLPTRPSTRTPATQP